MTEMEKWNWRFLCFLLAGLGFVFGLLVPKEPRVPRSTCNFKTTYPNGATVQWEGPCPAECQP